MLNVKNAMKLALAAMIVCVDIVASMMLKGSFCLDKLSKGSMFKCVRGAEETKNMGFGVLCVVAFVMVFVAVGFLGPVIPMALEFSRLSFALVSCTSSLFFLLKTGHRF